VRVAQARDFVLLLPKVVVTALLVLAVADMLAGVFFRYVMVEILISSTSIRSISSGSKRWASSA